MGLNNTEFHIMAQGKGSRWGSIREPAPTVYKQLLPLGEETIITRTLRQLVGCKVQVIANPDFSEYVPTSILKSLDEPTGALLRGIWMIAQEWTAERNVVLLGDVVYSNRAIKIMQEDKSTYNIYGRIGANSVTGKEASELFGFSVGWDRAWVLDKLLRLFNRREVEVGKKTARLWDLYDDSFGLVEVFDDYTDDVDSVGEYKQFYDALAEAAEHDDITWIG